MGISCSTKTLIMLTVSESVNDLEQAMSYQLRKCTFQCRGPEVAPISPRPVEGENDFGDR